MTKDEQLALARLKNLYTEARDTAFYCERSGNALFTPIASCLKLIAQSIKFVTDSAQQSNTKCKP